MVCVFFEIVLSKALLLGVNWSTNSKVQFNVRLPKETIDKLDEIVSYYQ